MNDGARLPLGNPIHALASNRQFREWALALVLGATIGTVVLGVGGRLAMRGISIASNQPAGFSVGGTLTVVFLGAVSGALGGLILALAHNLFPRRAWARHILFWTALLLLTARGLRPIQPLAAALFFPLVGVYGLLLQVAWKLQCTYPTCRSARLSTLGRLWKSRVPCPRSNVRVS